MPTKDKMFEQPDICWKCDMYAASVMLLRCRKCLVLGCEHNRGNTDDLAPVCITELRSCAEAEHTKVLRAWRDELNKSGICVSYSYSFDDCCEHLDRTDDNEWACSYCGKRVGKVPLPNSCAGCGGHSVDSDCPLHGRF